MLSSANLFKMSEYDQAPTQNEIRDLRPIGRFLLGLEDYKGEHDRMTYAEEFGRRPGNFQKYRHKSLKVSEADQELFLDGRKVTLEFSIDRYAYIWKIIVAAEVRLTEHIGTNYHSHGGEQYELHCASPKSSGSYSEYGSQGKPIREREFDSEEILNKIQGIVERLVEKPL